jgi:hypothetical protein
VKGHRNLRRMLAEHGCAEPFMQHQRYRVQTTRAALKALQSWKKSFEAWVQIQEDPDEFRATWHRQREEWLALKMIDPISVMLKMDS